MKLGRKLHSEFVLDLPMAVEAYMSITFLGNAVREFQELGWISTTPIYNIVPRLDINVATMTGITTVETVVKASHLTCNMLVGLSIFCLFNLDDKKR
ncbi:MAG: hypothetical protein P0116_04705 [Candidatus Nitrosocosmicus sp.]|nr:hypothetical protein [Candidatus Nitrosocosmicus sp.]